MRVFSARLSNNLIETMGRRGYDTESDSKTNGNRGTTSKHEGKVLKHGIKSFRQTSGIDLENSLQLFFVLKSWNLEMA